MPGLYAKLKDKVDESLNEGRMGKKYEIGDAVGPHGNILVDRYQQTLSSGTRVTKCVFLCSKCHEETFTAPSSQVASGKRHLCHKCTMEARQPVYKYHVGDKIGPHQTEILAIDHSNPKRPIGTFVCNIDGQLFTASIYEVASGIKQPWCPKCLQHPHHRKYYDGMVIGDEQITLVRRIQDDKDRAIFRCQYGHEFDRNICQFMHHKNPKCPVCQQEQRDMKKEQEKQKREERDQAIAEKKQQRLEEKERRSSRRKHQVGEKVCDGKYTIIGITEYSPVRHSPTTAIFECSQGHRFEAKITRVVREWQNCPECRKAKRKIYCENEPIGTSGIVFLCDLPNKNGKRFAKMKCHCGREFEHDIYTVEHDIVKSCGCTSDSGRFQRKFKAGDRLGPNRILFLGYTGKRDSSGGLLGEFQCPHCSNTYTVRVSRVSGGDGHTDCGCQEAKRRKAVGQKNIKDDLAGKKYGRLLVLRRTDEVDPDGTYLWECLCDCGNHYKVSRSHLIAGNTKSCGCLVPETSAANGRNNAKDLSGQRFGYLEALYRDGTIVRGKTCPHTAATWTCKCHNCGREVNGIVSYDLIGGNIISCGYCNATKGESALGSALEELGYEYTPEKSFETLINPQTGYPLHFDAYVSEINMLFEYDGQLHYVPHSQATFEEFAAANARDIVKNEWAIANGIPLIRIPYTSLDDICAEYLTDLISQAQSSDSNVFVPLADGAEDQRPQKF